MRTLDEINKIVSEKDRFDFAMELEYSGKKFKKLGSFMEIHVGYDYIDEMGNPCTHEMYMNFEEYDRYIIYKRLKKFTRIDAINNQI